MEKTKWILKCVIGGALFLALFGLVTMALWNWLVPLLFNGPELRFIEALGLLLLAKILFGGWGGRGCRCGGGGQYSWKHKYFKKLSAMSPEDRERFKARMREKWRCGNQSGEAGVSPGSNV